jgi:hypothetical protein
MSLWNRRLYRTGYVLMGSGVVGAICLRSRGIDHGYRPTGPPDVGRSRYHAVTDLRRATAAHEPLIVGRPKMIVL